MNIRPTSWRQQVVTGTDWSWRDGKLWHKTASERSRSSNPTGWTARFVENVYADQNRSQAVRTVLSQLLAEVPADGVAINVGAGQTNYPNVVNLEICDGSHIDIVGFGSSLPFLNSSVDLVIAQEVLEHVADYTALVAEVARVLKPGGRFYCQVPFQIGFHPGPCDFWRFSRQGLEQVFSTPIWNLERLSITLGHGSGFYRIAVEFVGVTSSCLSQRLYRPAKALAALALYPLKWFDFLTPLSKERDRIPGGYLCVARKP